MKNKTFKMLCSSGVTMITVQSYNYYRVVGNNCRGLVYM